MLHRVRTEVVLTRLAELRLRLDERLWTRYTLSASGEGSICCTIRLAAF